MPRPRREQSDPRVIRDWIKEGRGTGRNGIYKPWLRVQNVPSQGIRRRFSGPITGDRDVHVMSGLESDCFWILEWSLSVVDVREQFPLLPLDSTIEIARKLDVRPHTDRETLLPIVATTDFLVTTLKNGVEHHHALNIKPASELGTVRTQEKFEIQRIWHAKQGHSWSIVTAQDIPRHLAATLKLLREYRNLSGFGGVAEDDMHRIEEALLPLIWNAKQGLSFAAADCDKTLGLPGGTSLKVAYHFIYTRRWKVDPTQLLARFEPWLPIRLIEPQPQGSSGTVTPFDAALA